MRYMQVRLALEVMFEGTKGDTELGSVKPAQAQGPGVSQSLRVGDAVTVSYKAPQGTDAAQVVLEWEGGSTNDMLADAVIAIVLQVGECSFVWGDCRVHQQQRQVSISQGCLMLAAYQLLGSRTA